MSEGVASGTHLILLDAASLCWRLPFGHAHFTPRATFKQTADSSQESLVQLLIWYSTKYNCNVAVSNSLLIHYLKYCCFHPQNRLSFLYPLSVLDNYEQTLTFHLIRFISCALHQLQARTYDSGPFTQMLQGLCNDTSNTVFIENNEDAQKWVATSFWSDSIVFNENSMYSLRHCRVVAALTLTFGQKYSLAYDVFCLNC